MFIVDPHSGIPIYRQLMDQIRRMIAGGQLKPGAEMPSIRELAIRHVINPMTVSKVYSALEQEGLLERRRGKPMTVAIRKHPSAPVTERLAHLAPHVDQLVAAASQLGLSEAEAIRALRRGFARTSIATEHEERRRAR